MSNLYRVTITEEAVYSLEVEADSHEEAAEIALDTCTDSDLVAVESRDVTDSIEIGEMAKP